MRFTVESITPLMAQKYLEANKLNRALSESTIFRYGEDMKAGRWGLTHQAICFSEDGDILDGQHRLWAIFNTGCTVKMVVARGFAAESRDYIDQGKIRTVTDVLKISDPDSDVTNYTVAVARRMLIGNRTQVVASRQEQIEFLKENQDAINFALDDALQGKRVQRVTPAAVPAVIARAYYHEDRPRLKEFGAVMVGALPSGEHDISAHLLRSWLLSGSPEYGQRISRELLVYMKTQRAVRAFLDREKMKSLYLAKDEQWQIPGENRRLGGKKQTRKARAS